MTHIPIPRVVRGTYIFFDSNTELSDNDVPPIQACGPDSETDGDGGSIDKYRIRDLRLHTHYASLYSPAKRTKEFVVPPRSGEERYQPVTLGIQIGAEG